MSDTGGENDNNITEQRSQEEEETECEAKAKAVVAAEKETGCGSTTTILQKLEKSTRLPDKMMRILLTKEAPDAIWWLPKGDTFAIQKDKFDGEIVMKYFRGNKFKSLVRNMHRWGFRRMTCEVEPTAKTVVFSHPYFQRDKPDLVAQIEMINEVKEKRPEAKKPAWRKRVVGNRDETAASNNKKKTKKNGARTMKHKSEAPKKNPSCTTKNNDVPTAAGGAHEAPTEDQGGGRKLELNAEKLLAKAPPQRGGTMQQQQQQQTRSCVQSIDLQSLAAHNSMLLQSDAEPRGRRGNSFSRVTASGGLDPIMLEALRASRSNFRTPPTIPGVAASQFDSSLLHSAAAAMTDETHNVQRDNSTTATALRNDGLMLELLASQQRSSRSAQVQAQARAQIDASISMQDPNLGALLAMSSRNPLLTATESCRSAQAQAQARAQIDASISMQDPNLGALLTMSSRNPLLTATESCRSAQAQARAQIDASISMQDPNLGALLTMSSRNPLLTATESSTPRRLTTPTTTASTSSSSSHQNELQSHQRPNDRILGTPNTASRLMIENWIQRSTNSNLNHYQQADQCVKRPDPPLT